MSSSRSPWAWALIRWLTVPTAKIPTPGDRHRHGGPEQRHDLLQVGLVGEQQLLGGPDPQNRRHAEQGESPGPCAGGAVTELLVVLV
ncbi:hypothetical protein [Streptomyces halstedii]|uniref:hypothetical protein n=1 Tax=Streptomyces halstedii TaxID=1944 RepID=UPI003357840C